MFSNSDYQELEAERDALRARVAELEGQLPSEMAHCTIRFRECEKGHGRLVALNWVDHGCPFCKLVARDKALEEIRSAFDVWQHAPNTPDMNMMLCATIRRVLGTQPTSAPSTQGTSDPLHPTGRCTCGGGGGGDCIWCLSHCIHCGAGLVPTKVEDVPWLVKDFDVLYRVAERGLKELASCGCMAMPGLAEQLERLKPAIEHIQMVKAVLRERG